MVIKGVSIRRSVIDYEIQKVEDKNTEGKVMFDARIYMSGQGFRRKDGVVSSVSGDGGRISLITFTF